MGHVYEGIEELIGETPMLHAKRYAAEEGVFAKLYTKLEAKNPAGSAKDRVALRMLLAAERDGRLKKGGTVIEPTSGNTGIGLCALAAARGYKMIVVMPDTMSEERRTLMRAYGAELVLTPGAEGIAASVKKAEELLSEIPNSFMPGQFTNLENPLAHEETTAIEIDRDLDGQIDVLVAGVGTGGTLSGIAHYLRKQGRAVEIVAVEPSNSPFLSEGKSGAHALQGIGAGFLPDTCDRSVIDRILTVTKEDAYRAGVLFGQTEGVLVGISSGAALHAAVTLGRDPAYEGKNIVVICPDGGDHYLSTPGYYR